MNTFHYFIEGRNALKREEAAGIGLGYAFEKGVDFTQVARGPENKQGIIVAQQDSYGDGKNNYYPEKQKWLKLPAAGAGLTTSDYRPPSAAGGAPEIWVGYWIDSPPTPEDLAREQMLQGHPLRLRDKQLWTVPLARSYSEVGDGDAAELRWSINLPRTLRRGADGHWEAGDIDRQYAGLWALAEAWTGGKSLSSEDVINGAIICLATNYRVSAHEVELLGLVTDKEIFPILDLLTDGPTMTAFQKKMRERRKDSMPCGLPSSSAGPAGEIPDTAPPLPTLSP